MKFQFNVKLSEKDYIDFNMFWQIKSPYGRKQFIGYRIIIAIMFLIMVGLGIFNNTLSTSSIVDFIPAFVFLSVAEIFLSKFLSWFYKWHIKSLSKKGKLGYSPESVVEFYEDYFSEITTENKTEHKYTAIERISIVDNKAIYVHTNSLMAYILPLSCFVNTQQYNNFLEFIKTKCNNVDAYYK